MRPILFLAPLALLAAVPAQAQGKIAFGSNRSGNYEIWSMNADGSGVTNLTKTSSVDEDNPSWKWDGGKIAYQRTDDIWTMNADGTSQFGYGVGHIPMQAGFRPYTDLISYSRFGGFDHDVYIRKDDNSVETRIINNPLGDYNPRWSWDGKKIAFYTFNYYNGPYLPNVYIANADGSGQQQLTNTGKDQNARFSPDGGQLVFQSVRDGNNEIYIMNIDGSGVTRLTNSPGDDAEPAFSPDGKKIVFTSTRDGDAEIFVMNVDGTGVTQLTSNAAVDHCPEWSAGPLPADAPSVKIGDAIVNEGGGTNTASLTVSLSAASTAPVKVTYRTYDGTAKAGLDYTAVTPGTVTFAPGETSKTIAVPILGDALDEADETFAVRLAIEGAHIGDQTGTATIKDDDAAPSLDIHGVTVTEGNSGTTTLNFPINLTAVSGKDVSVHYATADDTALAGQDYVAKSGTAVIPAGSLTAVIPITIISDTVLEGSEGFFINLDTPVNATRLLHTQARGTISNDDTVPGVTISDATAAEGGAVTFTLTLSKSIGKAVTLTYNTSDGTAIAGSDYTAATGTVTIPAGQITATITVQTIDDSAPENSETFYITLSNPVNGQITDSTATGTITNEDFPEIFISSVTMREGNSGNRAMYFTVLLKDPAPFAVTVNYATADGTASAGQDYVAASGSVTIPANQTSVSLPIQLIGDATYESDETFTVELSGASSGTIPDPQGTGTIVNDDAAPPSPVTAAAKIGPSGKEN